MDKEEYTVPEAPEEQQLPQEELRETPPEEAPEERTEEIPEELTKALPEEDHTPEPEGGPSLSRRRRIAVVSYLALLFVVAFVLVAISLISESRKNQANAEASSALQKVEAVQAENRALQEEAKDLNRQISDLQAQLDAIQLQNEYAEAEYAAMNAELQRAQAALNEQTEITAAQQEAADLLFSALYAWRNSDPETFRADMKDLATRQGDLSPTALSVYEFLIGELDALGG